MTPLQRFLTDAEGDATVEAFMRWALYDSEHGYYARRIADVGQTGDFSTSATIAPALALAVAAWAQSHRADVAQRGRWHLIEVGPGNGRLAAEILRAFGWWTRSRVTYHLIETSAPLEAHQREELSRWTRGLFGPALRWHADLNDALREADGGALILSNEFVDALPCAVLARSAARDPWREVSLRWDDTNQHAVEVLNELSPERAAEISVCTQILPSSVSRCEVHFAYRDWLKDWRASWHRGRMLTYAAAEERERALNAFTAGDGRGRVLIAPSVGPSASTLAAHLLSPGRYSGSQSGPALPMPW